MQFVLPLAAGAGLLAGLLACAALLKEQLRQSGGPSIAFTDIECEPPPGLDRQELLMEARYLAELPLRISLLDPDANETIVRGLSAHPWVAEVRRVEQLPPGRVRVQLTYRVAVLAVERPALAVDRLGVLLPQTARRDALPVLCCSVAPPAGGPGHLWGDRTVTGAAAVAGQLLPHLKTLKLAGCRIEVDRGDLVLATAATRILWGRPPGEERAAEALAEEKVRRLLKQPALDGQEHDLRQASGIVRRTWPR
jgi:hypothetical protein